ncbi:MAG: 3-isopropylmalate dehydratase large subunit [Deltaproteobacteria bacterium RBG_13_52_11]|nr:MAG: 3-isopropylmalate dehydratase large subunit [Deltaproteobacteria bacterium RBG_13_52_11]
MGMTITEKILAAHAGLEAVAPGQIINARLDVALGNDITAPLAIKAFREIGATKVFDRNKVILVPDHFTPNKDIQSAEQCRLMREFAQEQGLTHYLEVGRMGIEHALLPEMGLVGPGYLVIGADSHTCTYGALGAFATGVGSTDLAAAMAIGEIWLRVPETIKFVYTGHRQPWVGGKDLILYTIGAIGVDGALYKAMEFTGETIRNLDMAGRFTMANMAIEAGGKNGIIHPDEITLEYLRGRMEKGYTLYHSDEDALYAEIREYDCSQIEPQVACPSSPANVKGVRGLAGITIDQAIIGSCTNGRLEDLRIAAHIIQGKKVAPYVRLIVIPATQEIYLQALREGLLEAFVEAGGAVSTPTCGPCLGGHMGVLGAGEVAIATTNRNFVGRMGHPTSQVYLSNPAVAAASAIKGEIVHPEEVANKE